MPISAHFLTRLTKAVVLFVLLLYVILVIRGLLIISEREIYTPQQLANTDVGKFANIDGGQVYYEYYASINPARANLVFIHGFGANTASFKDQIEFFGQDYNLVLIDMPGFGLSQQLGNLQLGPESQAQTVYALLQQIGVPNYVLIGHSYGGGVAQRLSLNHPENVLGLVLVDSLDLAAAPIAINLQGWSWLNSPLLLQSLAANFVNEQSLVQSLQSAYGDPSKLSSTVTSDFLRSYSVEQSFSNLLAQVFAPQNPRLAETGSILGPTLVIFGSQDRVIADDIKSNLQKGLCNAEWAELPGLGHIPHQEDAAVFNQVVADWLERTLDLAPAAL